MVVISGDPIQARNIPNYESRAGTVDSVGAYSGLAPCGASGGAHVKSCPSWLGARLLSTNMLRSGNCNSHGRERGWMRDAAPAITIAYESLRWFPRHFILAN